MSHTIITRLNLATTLFTVLVSTLMFSAVSFAGKPLKIGEQAPNWILSDSSNQQITFHQDSAGEPAVILFWATWCPYCAELMPELKAIQEQLSDTPVKFYALNVWEDGDASKYIAKHDYNFTLLLNADMVAKRYDIHGTPGLIVVDKDKVIRYIRTKGTSAEEAAEHVKAALAAAASP